MLEFTRQQLCNHSRSHGNTIQYTKKNIEKKTPRTHSTSRAQSQFRWFEQNLQRTDTQRGVLREIVDTLKYLINTEACLKSFIQVKGAITQIILAVPMPFERSVCQWFATRWNGRANNTIICSFDYPQ